MCIFQSGEDIPPLARISLRTLQYLVIPLLSLAILIVGSFHVNDCSVQPYIPLWHIVAGASGLLTPILYLLFDEINPWLSKTHPGVSEIIDNVVVFILPLYLIFEISWLITGSVWIFSTPDVTNPEYCDRTIYIFSLVVIINFWIHILTPLIFMFSLCFTRICPYIRYAAYWNWFKGLVQNWTWKTRMSLTILLSTPLGVSMVVVGSISLIECNEIYSLNNQSYEFRNEPQYLNEMIHIPVWLIVAGVFLLWVPLVYYIYDKYCKQESGGPLIRNIFRTAVIFFLLAGLAWALTGFVWVFGSHVHSTCGADSATYKFAFSTLIILNAIMDAWICFKICVVLYWAFLSDE